MDSVEKVIEIIEATPTRTTEEREEWLRIWKAEWLKRGMDPARCTCLQCPYKMADTCDFAFDMWNEDGDCLEEK